MPRPTPQIIHTDNHLLVIAKPSAMATMGADPSVPSVHRWGCDWVRDRYQKPGRVFLGVVHRLDAATSGVLVLARTSKAASRLAPQFDRTAAGGQADRPNRRRHAGTAEKRYLAVLEGELRTAQWWEDRLEKDDRAKRMRVSPSETRGRPARTMVWPIAQHHGRTLVELSLHTGRKHQIRVQASHRKMPVVGDPKYGHRRHAGANSGGPSSMLLHAWRLRLAHPIGAVPWEFVAGPPPDFAQAIDAMRFRLPGGSEHTAQPDPPVLDSDQPVCGAPTRRSNAD